MAEIFDEQNKKVYHNGFKDAIKKYADDGDPKAFTELANQLIAKEGTEAEPFEALLNVNDSQSASPN